MPQYEALFIVTPSFDEGGVAEVSEAVKELVEANDGQVLFVDLWGRRRLAYPVQGHGDGYYVLMVFNGESELLDRINNHFRITEPIIRHLVVTFEGDLDKLIAKQQETVAQASRRDSQEARKEPEPLPDVVSEDENNKESEE
ncbi:30S ribosomal protein S6 [Candidatus Poribacteria bacterium]|nr:30S ribosomal protein S6 [Candidatus Poribacteria bacterium]